ncbi:MAG: hypothetical protein J1F64_08620, partial [Oscillospiraceae bacterium]|nr:hypothetical protein [Oscillospiraceae bacterium]
MKIKLFAKRLMAFAVILSMALSLMPAFSFTAGAAGEFNDADGGNGIEGSPYEIATLEQLENLRDYINGTGNYDGVPHTGEGEYFILTADIDMSDKYNESGE